MQRKTSSTAEMLVPNEASGSGNAEIKWDYCMSTKCGYKYVRRRRTGTLTHSIAGCRLLPSLRRLPGFELVLALTPRSFAYVAQKESQHLPTTTEPILCRVLSVDAKMHVSPCPQRERCYIRPQTALGITVELEEGPN